MLQWLPTYLLSCCSTNCSGSLISITGFPYTSCSYQHRRTSLSFVFSAFHLSVCPSWRWIPTAFSAFLLLLIHEWKLLLTPSPSSRITSRLRSRSSCKKRKTQKVKMFLSLPSTVCAWLQFTLTKAANWSGNLHMRNYLVPLTGSSFHTSFESTLPAPWSDTNSHYPLLTRWALSPFHMDCLLFSPLALQVMISILSCCSPTSFCWSSSSFKM